MITAPPAPPASPVRCRWCNRKMVNLMGGEGYPERIVGQMCTLCDYAFVANRRPHPLLRGTK